MNNIELAERKCQLCQTSQIDDEIHYLPDCHFFLTERRNLISQYYYKRPNIIKYKELLNIGGELKLIRQGYRYFKLRKAFSKFYRRHSALLEKYSVSLKTVLQQGVSEPEFYGDLVYRFRRIAGKSNFLEQFRKLINRYKKNWQFSLDIMRQTACLVVNPIIFDGYASLFNCTTAVRASDSMTASSYKTLTSGLGLDDMSVAWPAVV